MLVIAGCIPIDPSKHDEVVAAATEMQRATLLEAGCAAYQFSFAVDNPGTMCIFEEWADQAALDAHFVTPHMAVFQGQLGGIVAGRPTVTKYEIASSGPLR